VCTDTGVRLLLSSRTPNVLRTNGMESPPAQAAKPPKQPDHVVLVFIYRIYMTRSIDYVYGADTSVAAAARAVLERSDAGQPQAPPALAAMPKAQTRLDVARDQFRESIEDVGQGGQVSVASVTANGVVLKVQLARPVVIGYSAIRTVPWPDAKASATQATNQSALSDR
jgi:hypothetical protein